MKAKRLIVSNWTICALVRGECCFVEEYLQGLNEPERKKLFALLQRSAEQGPPRRDEKCRKLENDLFEFKSFRDRVFWFYEPGKIVVLTHGFQKKGGRTPSNETARAKRLRDEWRSEGRAYA